VIGERKSADSSHYGYVECDGIDVLANYIITNAGAEFTIDKRLAT
jgi:hypothetical protein